MFSIDMMPKHRDVLIIYGVNRLDTLHVSTRTTYILHLLFLQIFYKCLVCQNRLYRCFEHVQFRVAPDIISGPGRNPAKFSYPAPAGYGRRI